MKLAELIDRCIEPFNPSLVRRRLAERQALEAMRDYDAARYGRRTSGWRRPGTSADAELRKGLVALRNSSRDLVRNSKYAAAAVRQIVANTVGDGIVLTLTHDDKDFAKTAQKMWDDWAASQVCGSEDFYGAQKLAFRGVVESGEVLIVWQAGDSEPDAEFQILEGDLLDHLKHGAAPGGGRIVQGVEYDRRGRVVAYWLFDEHPGDLGVYGVTGFGQSKRYDAKNIDHLFEILRPGQSRGQPWLTPGMMTLRDVGDYEDAVLMKKKVEACLALVLTPPEAGGPPGPFDETGTVSASAGPGGAGSNVDTLRPGMVFRARPGETATTLAPTSSGDGVDFVRQQLMGVAANLVPYHYLSGDPSQANYSSSRALTLPFHANLDDWQHNLIIPRMLLPAFRRRMAVWAAKTGDKRFLELRAKARPPPRRMNDPIKDFTGELMEIRAGMKSMPQALAERGRNPDTHLQEIADFNAAADALRLAFDSDPRRTTDSGVLQAAAGYLYGAGGANQGN